MCMIHLHIQIEIKRNYIGEMVNGVEVVGVGWKGWVCMLHLHLHVPIEKKKLYCEMVNGDVGWLWWGGVMGLCVFSISMSLVHVKFIKR